MPIKAVSRELLVRYLDTWVPSALHGSRRATFAQIWHEDADIDAADASLRVFAEFADRMRGCRTTLVFIAPRLGSLQDRLDRVQAELKTPPDLAVHVVAGDPGTTLKPALVAAQAAGAPLFVYADCDILPPLASL